MTARNERILVIDDDRDIRDIIRLILELEGFKVDVLDNGHFVDETILSFKPQLILLDVMLGDMDGRQICQNLKKQPNTQDIPIIIISATHGPKLLLEELCGADDYISKPFDIDNLISRVNLNLSK
ncbi:response regulator [Mucilaginibacter rubeus]|uniref:Response regulator n=1 Tax=Mucilaginibacter rubeus TaxID=2027860 RepID=A0AAE6JCG1_9SPHI|nr:MULTISPECIES: response regulator [Mucilaginibacter]QEM02998.1 response regulator [Mucilaginibacter rubeus]QEM15616.1 response regulator [Mucilaginibacter gossypii]QTE41649.1 response regulator [Mucilaginibacter rubeus]QTE48254.1 response regulator [Mucilaginibacter rubeus]QTE59642.1 response regulator [Mucilaginibacter rubeus]